MPLRPTLSHPLPARIRHSGRRPVTGLVLLALAAGLMVGPARPSQAATPQVAPPWLPWPNLPGYYAAPDGSPNGDGSAAAPWDLQTALNGPHALGPGSTLWLRGGIYQGAFTSKLVGTAARPIIVRALPGERVTLDSRDAQTPAGLTAPAALTISNKAHGGWYWGLEITNSSPSKDCPVQYALGAPLAPNCGAGVIIGGSDNKLIDLVVHDTGRTCIGSELSDTSSEISGAVAYNCGQGNGHGIYTRNTGATTKVIRGNILADEAGYALQIFGATAPLKGFAVDGNVFVNDAVLAGGKGEDDPSGGSVVENLALTNNFLYRSPLLFGYHNDQNRDVTVTNNVLISPDGSQVPLTVKWFRQVAVSGNRFYSLSAGSTPFLHFVLPAGMSDLTAYALAGNHYAAPAPAAGRAAPPPAALAVVDADGGASQRYTAAQLQAAGLDRDATYDTTPTAPATALLPDPYDPERWVLVVDNYPRQPTVYFDPAALGLAPDREVVLRNALNYYAADQALTVTVGDGPLVLPMTGWTLAAPVSPRKHDIYPDAPPFPAFGVFVLTAVPQPPAEWGTRRE